MCVKQIVHLIPMNFCKTMLFHIPGAGCSIFTAVAVRSVGCQCHHYSFPPKNHQWKGHFRTYQFAVPPKHFPTFLTFCSYLVLSKMIMNLYKSGERWMNCGDEGINNKLHIGRPHISHTLAIHLDILHSPYMYTSHLCVYVRLYMYM